MVASVPQPHRVLDVQGSVGRRRDVWTSCHAPLALMVRFVVALVGRRIEVDLPYAQRLAALLVKTVRQRGILGGPIAMLREQTPFAPIPRSAAHQHDPHGGDHPDDSLAQNPSSTILPVT